jgi:hypothetical protein
MGSDDATDVFAVPELWRSSILAVKNGDAESLFPDLVDGLLDDSI